MSKQEEIAALRQEIKSKEKQLYQVTKDMSAWNKGMAKSHANAQKSRLFIESQRKEITELQLQLLALEKKDR
jgi:uncharacterized coiled-coil DUF342 family protein